MVERRVIEELQDVIAQSDSGCPIHHGMFAHDPSIAIIKYDELHRLVNPAIPESNGNSTRDIAMPEGAAVVYRVGWGGGVQTYCECGGLDVVQNGGVMWGGGEFGVILGMNQ